MMGVSVGQQDRLFYEFNLEDRVPTGHLLRRLDAVLDLIWLRSGLSPFYSHTGRPSVDPERMIRMRRLGLEDAVPDHSTFSVNRHGRFRDSDVLRSVFENVVHRCMEAKLVGGEGFAVDASVIEADASRFVRVEGAEIDWTDEQQARRPIREYLDALDGEHSSINPRQKPPVGAKALSPTDPAAAWTTRGRNKVMFGYSLNYLIDMENVVIVDVEATPTRISREVEATGVMLARTQARFDLRPRHIAGDMAYGTGRLLGWLREQRIEPHIPVRDKGRRDDGTLSRGYFAFDKECDVYVCPKGKVLMTTGTVHDGRTLLYRSSKRDCDPCLLKPRCCPRTPSRKIPRDINEAARDHARSLNGSEACNRSARDRKKIERLFGEAKSNLAMTRLRLRGPSGARDEFLLTATVQNLKRLVKHVSRSPPGPMMA